MFNNELISIAARGRVSVHHSTSLCQDLYMDCSYSVLETLKSIVTIEVCEKLTCIPPCWSFDLLLWALPDRWGLFCQGLQWECPVSPASDSKLAQLSCSKMLPVPQRQAARSCLTQDSRECHFHCSHANRWKVQSLESWWTLCLRASIANLMDNYILL